MYAKNTEDFPSSCPFWNYYVKCQHRDMAVKNVAVGLNDSSYDYKEYYFESFDQGTLVDSLFDNQEYYFGPFVV